MNVSYNHQVNLWVAQRPSEGPTVGLSRQSTTDPPSCGYKLNQRQTWISLSLYCTEPRCSQGVPVPARSHRRPPG